MDAETTERIKREIAYERSRTAPPEDFPRLPDIPAGRYVDPLFFALEQERLWPRSWLMVGHRDELPERGSYFRWDVAGMPLFVVRGRDDRVRAYFNTCSHRGGPVVQEAAGRAITLRCGYHGWTYDLEGRLIGVPDERDFVGLDKSCRSLSSLRCESWGGFLFVCLDDETPSLLDFLGSVPDETADFGMDSIRLVERQRHELACNWKVAVDAFLETYHLECLHPHSVAKLIDHRGATMGLLPNGHSRMPTPVREERLAARAPGVNPLDVPSVGEIGRLTNLAYSVFPNLITPLEPAGFPILLFWPRDLRTTTMEVLWFGGDWGEGDPPETWPLFIRAFASVLAEDTQFLPSIQRSMESPAFRGVPLSYQERRIYHLHEEIDRVIGVERVPEALRVEPLMAPYVEGAT